MIEARLREERRKKARAWALLGWVLILVGMLVAMAGLEVVLKQFGFIAALAVSLLGMGGTALGSRWVIYAKRLRAPSALDTLAHDPRPPVVYFRPFAADIEASQTVWSTSWQVNEEQLCAAMNDIGPLVAIGVPQEPLPHLGAARLYVDDSEWQAAARELMERAAIVLLRIGRSRGFWWEFTTAVRCLAPQKLVLLIPRDKALYEEFRDASRLFLPRVLPPFESWGKKKWFRGDLKALIFFDTVWSPSVVDVQTLGVPFLRFAPNMPLVPVLQFALRPICANAGLHWKAPGINRRLVTCIALVAMCFALLFVLPVLMPDVKSILLALTMMTFGYQSFVVRSAPVALW